MTHYDTRGRVMKLISDNAMGGIETKTTTYTFTGKPVVIKHTHTASGESTQTETYKYTYDHADRLVKVTHQLNENSPVILSESEYDELGRLVGKQFHGNTSLKTTYSYNIRNWITSVSSNSFLQNLSYITGPGTACYNGNISSMSWRTGTGSSQRYDYTYDGLNRLLSSDYHYGGTLPPLAFPPDYSEKVLEYDKQGNILRLQRYGLTDNPGQGTSARYNLVDDLLMEYNGNQLANVSDGGFDPLDNGSFNYVDLNKDISPDFKYDANGNLTQDLDKEITSITYNCLNLPDRIKFGGINDLRENLYDYDASGIKRSVVHVTPAPLSISPGQGGIIVGPPSDQSPVYRVSTVYCDNLAYTNTVKEVNMTSILMGTTLDRILTDEGYITFDGTTPIYHYYLKDYQGNVRVVMNQNGTTMEQENSYYPFGGIFNVNAADVQPYKFGGKELDRIHGLDWCDFGGRHLRNDAPGWMSVDPLCEKYYSMSPYSYCANNPIRYIDPTGLAWRLTYNEDHDGNRTYNGYEWVSEDESYDEYGHLKRGLYAQAIFFSYNGTFDEKKKYNIGSSTATVYLADGTTLTFDASTNPSKSTIFATVPEGIYHATVGTHHGSKKNHTALKMRDVEAKLQTVELGTINPAYSDGRTYATGIDIHKAGNKNLTGMLNDGRRGVSEGCLLIDINNWSNFISIFDNSAQRSNKVSVTVSRTFSMSVNATRLPAFNFIMNGSRANFFNFRKR